MAELPSLSGKTALVTGGSSGLGLSIVKLLARQGAKVYMAARSEERAQAAIDDLKKNGGLGVGAGDIVWHSLDQSDPRSAKKSAEDFLAKETRLDILINNAALLWEPFELTSDGMSTTMVVNYISVFVFTQTLLPLLKSTSKEEGSDVRIVTISSGAHMVRRAADKNIRFKTIEDFSQEYKEDNLAPFSRYCVSKLAITLYVSELQKRLIAEGFSNIISLSLHPGAVNTIQDRLKTRPLAFVTTRLVSLLFSTPDVAAYIPCWAASSPVVKQQADKYQGAYLRGVAKIGAKGKNAQREDLAEELWSTTESILTRIGI